MAKKQLSYTLEGAIQLLEDCDYGSFLELGDLYEEDFGGSKSELERLAKAFHKAYRRISPTLPPDKLAGFSDRAGFIGAKLYNLSKQSTA